MKIAEVKSINDKKKIIDASIARVAGAVRVASIAVSAAVAIKNEAVDEVEALKT